ncbi:MAG: hypothetical protein C5S38_04215 [Candidatus Methanophagaceae archaeon]|nr:MAG: hypothetical protein C5S38_04215 [Methanophagales archaeon]KAF5433595.1 putative protein YuzE [Methanophagales archaeon]
MLNIFKIEEKERGKIYHIRIINEEIELMMQIKYSPDADVLLVKLREGKLVDSVDVAEGLIAHYGEDGSVLEIEILDASTVVELKNLSFSLTGMLTGHQTEGVKA